MQMSQNTATPPDPAAPARPKIATPCIAVCQVSGRTGLCEGCFRTLKEIGGWRRMTDEARAAIMADLPRRKTAAEASWRNQPVTDRSSAG